MKPKLFYKKMQEDCLKCVNEGVSNIDVLTKINNLPRFRADYSFLVQDKLGLHTINFIDETKLLIAKEDLKGLKNGKYHIKQSEVIEENKKFVKIRKQLFEQFSIDESIQIKLNKTEFPEEEIEYYIVVVNDPLIYLGKNDDRVSYLNDITEEKLENLDYDAIMIIENHIGDVKKIYMLSKYIDLIQKKKRPVKQKV